MATRVSHGDLENHWLSEVDLVLERLPTVAPQSTEAGPHIRLETRDSHVREQAKVQSKSHGSGSEEGSPNLPALRLDKASVGAGTLVTMTEREGIRGISVNGGCRGRQNLCIRDRVLKLCEMRGGSMGEGGRLRRDHAKQRYRAPDVTMLTVVVNTVNSSQSRSTQRWRLAHRCQPGLQMGPPRLWSRGQRRLPATLSFIASSEASTPLPERGKAVSVRLIERTHQEPCVSEWLSRLPVRVSDSSLMGFVGWVVSNPIEVAGWVTLQNHGRNVWYGKIIVGFVCVHRAQWRASSGCFYAGTPRTLTRSTHPPFLQS